MRKQGGFTLLEALLAAAILGITGFVLAVSFNNGQLALLNWETNSEVEQFQDWAIRQIDFENMDLDTLETGDEILSPEDFRFEWTGTAQPTAVLDVFLVELHCTVSGSKGLYQDLTVSKIVSNTKFYENDSDRQKLVVSKSEHFEDLQEARQRL